MEIDEKIALAAEEFANKAQIDSEDSILCSAAVQIAVREVIWALYENNKDYKHAIVDMLHNMQIAVADTKEAA